MLKSYKELTVWQRSMQLVKEIYSTTSQLPKSEVYGLSSQMRRAAVSIPSNIAEGYKRRNLGEYIQFLAVADASAAELETQILLSKDIYREISFAQSLSLLEETQKMLTSLTKRLKGNPKLNPIP